MRATDVDAVLISGDIAEAHDVIGYLKDMDDAWEVPIYFVLGNHDYYHGSVAAVRQEVQELCRLRPRLVYLTAEQTPIQLVPGWMLVGHDGWGDGRLGNYEQSTIRMIDSQVIADLAGRDKKSRLAVLQRLGDEAAEHARRLLPLAFEQGTNSLLITHVPPLREACWHEGQPSDDYWAPHFTCGALGRAIMELMPQHPSAELTVLCGHTHGGGHCLPLPNVEIWTGGADYGSPRVQRVLDLTAE